MPTPSSTICSPPSICWTIPTNFREYSDTSSVKVRMQCAMSRMDARIWFASVSRRACWKWSQSIDERVKYIYQSKSYLELGRQFNNSTLCPWCLPYSLHTQHMRAPDWQASSRHTNSMAWTWCCGHRVFSWGLSASGTRRCLTSVRVEWVSWEHSAHRWVAHTVQYMEAVWFSSSSQRMMRCTKRNKVMGNGGQWIQAWVALWKSEAPYLSHAFQGVVCHSWLIGSSILETL